MKIHLKTVLSLTFFISVFSTVQAQKDSTAFDSKFGASLNYTGSSLIESSIIELQFKYTIKHHAVSLGPHIAYHDLFGGQDDWERYGVSFTYEYFPIRSNRMFSPFIFYDLNYFFSKSRREVTIPTSDGTGLYSASREVTMNGLSHHFGIGTRCNFYKGLFLHLSAGAGPATYGNSVYLRPLHSSESDVRESESPFDHYQTVFTFRFGLSYQISLSKLKKGNPEPCCN